MIKSLQFRRRLAGVMLVLAAVTAAAAEPDDRVEIAVVKNGWHTELELPIDQMSGPLVSFDPTIAGAHFLIAGFGARDYFMDPDAGMDKAMAALIPGPSVMQLSSYQNPPEQSFEGEHQIVRLSLTRDGLDRIANFIWSALERDDSGKPILLRDDRGARNVFYSASHSYSALYTCNSWTAQALFEGGLPFSAAGVLFADQVMSQARRIAEQQAVTGH